jgi:hypothetical protein
MEKGKWKAAAAAAIILLLAANLWIALDMKTRQDSLEREMSQMNLQLYNHSNNMDYALNTAVTAMENKIEDVSSILSGYDMSLSYADGKIIVGVNVVPKAVYAQETVSIALDTESGAQKAAAQADGTGYKANVSVPPCDSIQATVVFESPQGVRRETLPEVNVRETLGFNCESKWMNEAYPDEAGGGVLTVVAYNGVQSVTPYIDPKRVQLVVESADGTETGRVDAQAEQAEEPALELGGNVSDEAKQRAFVGNLSEYVDLVGHYNVYFELESAEGLNYRAYVADFENDGEGFGGWSANGGTVYPQFEE